MRKPSPPAQASPTTRPALHLTANEGWINDPLGLTYHEGRYHLFFQYIPAQTVWSPGCWWGHAVTEDLLTWSELAPILKPGDGDDGCWSGSLAINDEGRATIFYTSIQLDDLNIGRIRTAQPVDDTWNTWQKGPFIDGVDPGDVAILFRDPHISRDRNGWRMLVGSGRADGTATALAYTSPNLTEWTFHGEFASRSSAEQEPVWTGKVWECPQLIPIGSKQALLFSVWEPWIPHYEAYAIGNLINSEFIVEHWGRLSYGDSYYAGAVFADAAGRPGMIYWLRGVADTQERWAGAHSLPHLLRLGENNQLIAAPHPNVAKRRGPEVKILADVKREVALPLLAEVEWHLSPDRPATLSVRSNDEMRVVDIRANDSTLQIEIADKIWTMPASESVRLIFDGPIVELFGSSGVFSAPIPFTRARTISLTDGSCSIYDLLEHMHSR